MLRTLLIACSLYGFAPPGMAQTPPQDYQDRETLPNDSTAPAAQAWFDAFNAGDAAALERFYQRYADETWRGQEDAAAFIARMAAWRSRTGGLQVDKVNAYTPKREQFVFHVRARADGAHWVVRIRWTAADRAGGVTIEPPPQTK